MPAFATHLYIAQEIVRTVRQHGTKDEARSLALQRGALSHDLGYFGDSDPFLSDLAHYVSPSALASSLVGTSGDTCAFGIGWLSHVVADCSIHPFVNERVGELFGRESMNYEEDPKEHLRVELGLDAAFFASLPPEKRPVFPSGFHEASDASLLQDGYRSAYGVDFPVENFVRAQRNFARYGRKLFNCSRMLGALFSQESLSSDLLVLYLTEYLPLRLLVSVVGKQHKHYGIARCLKPKQEHLELYSSLVQGVVQEMVERISNREFQLAERNLDTGRDLAVDADYPPVRRTKAALMRMTDGRGE